MAVQLHVAFSNMFKGAGVIAGGPYYCAKNEFENAAKNCMMEPENINVKELVGITDFTFASCGCIDNPKNLKEQPVWMFHSSLDTRVKQGVSDKL